MFPGIDFLSCYVRSFRLSVRRELMLGTGDCGERGECGWREGRHGADERSCWSHPCRAEGAFLSTKALSVAKHRVSQYMVEFISDDPERDVKTFLLTAAGSSLPSLQAGKIADSDTAVGMLYKRGATISAAEGGCVSLLCGSRIPADHRSRCMAEVGVASSMAAAGFAACMGGTRG